MDTPAGVSPCSCLDYSQPSTPSSPIFLHHHCATLLHFYVMIQDGEGCFFPPLARREVLVWMGTAEEGREARKEGGLYLMMAVESPHLQASTAKGLAGWRLF